PIEIVDFIIRSVNEALQEEFGQTLGSEGVHILDPFAGTGTFITRLLQSGLIAPEDMERKYREEVHANEIVLLAYYIAAINIESVFHSVASRDDYLPYAGICLTDTFALHEGDDELSFYMKDNTDRRERQKGTHIRVIVGNPPWSAGQRSAADANPNTFYPGLSHRITATFAARSTSQNKNSLHDTYKMAIRWASDRIGEQGVVAFVTNGSWIDGNVDSGVRACLAEEFSSIWVLNLRGNQRTQGERSRKEGGKVFGQGSRAPVTITLLVRNPPAKRKGCRILYRDVGDYLKREEKLALLRDWGGIDGITDWQKIQPNRHHDWIDKRNEDFQHLYPIGTKEAKAGKSDEAVFGLFSSGYKTSRDAYLYNFSRAACAENARLAIEDYMAAMQDAATRPTVPIDQVAQAHQAHVRWDRELKNNLKRRKSVNFSPANVWHVQYRPFVRQHCYVDYALVSNKYQMDLIFPFPASLDGMDFEERERDFPR
ncbi:MAG: damage-inducible protein, partial [Gemmatimonadetes bacterium]|nr:damage-inducible protein [Gemmatimonadota bacterium]